MFKSYFTKKNYSQHREAGEKAFRQNNNVQSSSTPSYARNPNDSI